jgi:hypothetical protein
MHTLDLLTISHSLCVSYPTRSGCEVDGVHLRFIFVCGPYVVTCLKYGYLYVSACYMTRFVIKIGHQEDMCHYEIGSLICARKMLFGPG